MIWVKPHLRVKGSDLQSVLLWAEQAKEEGKILVIEEADLLCPKVLESLLDPMKYPYFSIIATVNGIEYSGRQPVSQGLNGKAVMIHCHPVSLNDLRGLLGSKFSTDLTHEEIELIVECCRYLTIPLSPREIYSIVLEYLESEESFKRLLGTSDFYIEKFRPSVQLYRDSLQEESKMVKGHRR